MSADVVVVSSAFAATALLALGMKTHSRVVVSKRRLERVPALVWKAAGWLGVALALAMAVGAHGWGVGVVLWLLALGATGFVVTLVLSYRARWLPIVATGTFLLTGVLAWCCR